MKGKAPTPGQKRFYGLLCDQVGCIVCLTSHNKFNDHCSIHHIDGRTKANANWFVLPLCAGHHQHGTGPDKGKMMTGRHATIRDGGKAAFEARYGSEEELYLRCFERLYAQRETVPEGARMTLATLLEQADIALPLNFGSWVYGHREVSAGHEAVFS